MKLLDDEQLTKITPGLSPMMPIEILNFFWKMYNFFSDLEKQEAANYKQYQNPIEYDANHYMPGFVAH
ncbi:MAG: hypothetical protein ACRAS9_01375 [Mycoplasma sp.]